MQLVFLAVLALAVPIPFQLADFKSLSNMVFSSWSKLAPSPGWSPGRRIISALTIKSCAKALNGKREKPTSSILHLF